PLPPLGLTVVREAVAPVVQRGADRAWSLADLDWRQVRPELLTDEDRSAVRFVTFIEDHIPGYLTWLLRTAPVDGSDLPTARVAVHREYVRFFIAWAYDEERHAAALTRYQEAAAVDTPDALRLSLAEAGRAHFDRPCPDLLGTFTYTMLQEKATQLFYQRFRAVTREPVLRRLLTLLARDEARHFGLYSQLVEAYVRRDPKAAAPHLKDVLRTFRMPLAETLPRYRRWSLDVADHCGYDHTEAYGALERLLRRYTDSRGGDGVDDLATFVTSLRALP
ncbi:acyl-ACP desaturase, partial [Streptomyces clavuligerus]